VFLDADEQVCPGALVGLVDTVASDGRIAAAFGSYDDQPVAPPLVSRFRNLLHHYIHQVGNPESSTFWAGFGCIRRDVFDEAGGYDCRFGGASIEDVDLGLRIVAAGQRVRLCGEYQVKHAKRWTLSSMIATDFWCRGVPWTHAILQNGHLTSDLAVSWSQRFSAVLSLAVAVLLVMASVIGGWPAAALAALAGAWWIGDRYVQRPASIVMHEAVISALVAGVLASVWAASGILALAALACLTGVVLLNSGFYRLVLRRMGWLGFLPSLSLHILFFLNASLALVYGTVTCRSAKHTRTAEQRGARRADPAHADFPSAGDLAEDGQPVSAGETRS
jgi:hypothetical protein